MNNYETHSLSALLSGNSYPGRGILIGRMEDAQKACVAYFIMGRSQNSQNRVFVERENALFTEPFDAARVEDPSLILYAPLRTLNDQLIVSNGDQTDTIYRALQEGKNFVQALEMRRFEPDAPNFTPRISGLMHFSKAPDFSYELSILKSIDAEGTDCCRMHFSYPSKPGLGHLLHTYQSDGAPIPSFQGEPRRVRLAGDIDSLTGELWNALDVDNRISLYVRLIDLEDGSFERRLINKNEYGKGVKHE
ncbi:MAG: IMP cyclohydrolase [Ndongobacter sp.]|nr:IMP cyclohydrolase [Ndongobacter sp.]